MARSVNVWIVVDAMDADDWPMAAFTVKHEMVRWLKTRTDHAFLRVLRYPDGRYEPEDVREFPISELVS